jgi:hypothetical protein
LTKIRDPLSYCKSFAVMNLRQPSTLRTLLGLWLALSVLAAGLLAHAPALHAAIHVHHSHGDHDADASHDEELPGDHLCLIQLLADGGCEGTVALPALCPIFLPVVDSPPRGTSAARARDRHLLPPGRAPPCA